MTKNSQALIVYTVDWDGNNSTADDRDVFMLIYDYGKNIFTHNVRISGEAGAYANPKFATLDGDVYLFFTAVLPLPEIPKIRMRGRHNTWMSQSRYKITIIRLPGASRIPTTSSARRPIIQRQMGLTQSRSYACQCVRGCTGDKY